jgi:Transposase DDE domain group 1
VGERQSTLFTPAFNGSIQVEAREERLSADAGALLLREVFSRLGMDEFFTDRLVDPRCQELITHPQIELLRAHLLLLAQGWQDQDDADLLRHDPVMRLAVSQRRGASPLQSPAKGALLPDGLASQPTLSRLVQVLGSQEQRAVLRQALLELPSRRTVALRGHRLRYATLDVDSLPIEVHGHQEGSSFNGHYGVRCYHPLVAMIGETGDLVDVQLREGHAHTAEGALEFILPLLDRLEREFCQVASVRMDAGFPEDKLLSALEDRRVGYVARIRKNERLKRLAEPLLQPLAPPSGPEPALSFHELSYQAGKWSAPRRIVLVLQQAAGEMFPEYFFLLTNWSAEQRSAVSLLDLYRQRGTAEGHFGELMSVFGPALSSTRRTKSHYRGETPKQRFAPQDPFAANEVKLLLNALAYNLVHTARCLLEETTRESWSLSRLLERVLRVPARVVLHARQAMVVIPARFARSWNQLCRALCRLRWQPIQQAA